MRFSEEWDQVMFAEGVERNPAFQKHFLVAVGIVEQRNLGLEFRIVENVLRRIEPIR